MTPQRTALAPGRCIRACGAIAVAGAMGKPRINGLTQIAMRISRDVHRLLRLSGLELPVITTLGALEVLAKANATLRNRESRTPAEAVGIVHWRKMQGLEIN